VQTILFLVFAVDLVAALIIALADAPLVADGEASSSEKPNGTRRLRMAREARNGRNLRHRARRVEGLERG
jgi:hypothetical protein